MGNRGWKKRWSEGKRRLYCVVGNSAGCWALNSPEGVSGCQACIFLDLATKFWIWPTLQEPEVWVKGNLPWSDVSPNSLLSLKFNKNKHFVTACYMGALQFWKIPCLVTYFGTLWQYPWRLPSANSGSWCIFTSLMCLEDSFCWSGIRFRVFQICTLVSDSKSASFPQPVAHNQPTQVWLHIAWNLI